MVVDKSSVVNKINKIKLSLFDIKGFSLDGKLNVFIFIVSQLSFTKILKVTRFY